MSPARILAFTFSSFLLVSSGSPSASAQSKVAFEAGSMGVAPPVKIVKVLVDGTPVEIGTSIAVKPGWVSRLEIDVENDSSKDIVAGDAILIFADSGSASAGTPSITSVSNLGRYPASAFRNKDGTQGVAPPAVTGRSEIHVYPGEIMKFYFTVDGAVAEKAASQVAVIRTVRIMLTSFYFLDGTKWSNGKFLIPAEAPRLWNIATPDQFARFTAVQR